MPLPLPNLDTRKWTDLVEEGRALIPRFAPGWTDHNIHDPGVTLIELFAYLTEELLYRANRIPDRHRRKFLALLGYSPEPPQPASCVLGVTLAPATPPFVVPMGTVFTVSDPAGVALPFRTIDDASVVDAQLAALQTFDGKRYHDRSRAARELLAVQLFGPSPSIPKPYAAASAPSFYLGFDRALPKTVPARLHFRFAGAMRNERQRILQEAAEIAEECVRPPACTPRCPPPVDSWCVDESGTTTGAPTSAPAGTKLPPHHSVRTVWEYLAADGWHTLDPLKGEVDDQTRSSTLAGLVALRIPGDMVAASIGAVTAPRWYVRCRLVSGAFDSAPLLVALTMNALVAEQAVAALERFVIDAGVVPVGVIMRGQRTRLALDVDAKGVIQHLEAGVTDPAAPELLVVDYLAPAGGAAGEITLDVTHLEDGTGLPDQERLLADAPVSHAEVSVWTLESTSVPARRWTRWEPRADLDSARALDRRVMLSPTRGELRFGDGARGRVVADKTPLLAAFASTAAGGGDVAAKRAWSLTEVALNHALLGPRFTLLAAATVANALPAEGGADEEDIGAAATRAASALWSHERLVRLCPAGDCATLDQLDHPAVLDLPAPDRATTLLDFERIALEIPGTRVRRARAWARLVPVR